MSSSPTPRAAKFASPRQSSFKSGGHHSPSRRSPIQWAEDALSRNAETATVPSAATPSARPGAPLDFTAAPKGDAGRPKVGNTALVDVKGFFDAVDGKAEPAEMTGITDAKQRSQRLKPAAPTERLPDWNLPLSIQDEQFTKYTHESFKLARQIVGKNDF